MSTEPQKDESGGWFVEIDGRKTHLVPIARLNAETKAKDEALAKATTLEGQIADLTGVAKKAERTARVAQVARDAFVAGAKVDDASIGMLLDAYDAVPPEGRPASPLDWGRSESAPAIIRGGLAPAAPPSPAATPAATPAQPAPAAAKPEPPPDVNAQTKPAQPPAPRGMTADELYEDVRKNGIRNSNAVKQLTQPVGSTTT